MSVVLSRPKSHRPQWHELLVASIDRLNDEAISLAFAVPVKLRATFDFSPGQHLTFRRYVDGEEVRRSYSICSTPTTLRDDGILRVGIKKVPAGTFSGYAHAGVEAGSVVEVLPPLGSFGGEPAARWQNDPAAAADVSRHYVGIVAGSGITPVMSIAATALEREPESKVTLIFGNKTAASVMFVDELADLKDRYPQRFQLIHVLSREPQAAELLYGRIDPQRLALIFEKMLPPDSVDDWYLCGPFGMVTGAQKALADAGIDESHVHTELFYAEEIPPPPPEPGSSEDAEATIVLDGRASTVSMRRDERVLDAALRVRQELPYACKGGVCATCRAKLLDGEVHMARNFALDQTDLDAGYVLTCQSSPLTETVTVDYDA